jgi:hypothetical protein
LIKVDTELTEISVTVDIPGLAFEAKGPFDHSSFYDPAAKGELKPKPTETEDTAEGKNKPVKKEPEPEKETEKETQEETTPANYGIDRAEGFYCQANDTSYASAEEFQAKCQAPTSTVTPSTPADPTAPGPTLSPDTITEARSGGGGLLLLALAALLGD